MAEETAGSVETTLSSGARIIGGAYEVERLIKAGGMGEVYRGRNVQTGRNVAIKIILASLARNETYMALFEREALILEELAHEAIVRYQLYAVDQTTGRPCLVMQFVPGPSLKERMEQGPMSSDDIRVLTKRLALGLNAAHTHEYRVFHRDLSPDNVILEDGRVEKAKLIDFGIAKGGAQTTEKSVLAGQIAGKFSYMAPEQLGLFGEDIDARTDIYSLGLILLGLFRGQAVDMGKNIGEAVMRRHSVPDLSAVSPEMQPLLARMLNPHPEERPLNMAEVLKLLEQAQPLHPRPISEMGAGSTVLTPKPETTPPPGATAPVTPLPVTPIPAQVTPPPDLGATEIAPLPQTPAAIQTFDLDATVIRRPPVPTAPAAEPDNAEPDTAGADTAGPDAEELAKTVVAPRPLPQAPTPKAAPDSGPESGPEPESESEPEFAPASGPDLATVIAPAAMATQPAADPLDDLDDLVPPMGKPTPVIGLAAAAPRPKVAPAPAKKSGLLLPLILVGGLIGLGGAGYVFMSGSSTPPATTVKTATAPAQPAPVQPTPVPAQPVLPTKPVTPAKPEVKVDPAPVKQAAAIPPAPKPEPEPKPAPTEAEIRTAVLTQLTPARQAFEGACTFLRLQGGEGAALTLRGIAPTPEAASAALQKITPPEGAKLATEASAALGTALCPAVELANLTDATKARAPIALHVQGLTNGAVKAGGTLKGQVTGADSNTQLFLIGGETGRVTPLALTDGAFDLTLGLDSGTAAEMLLAVSPGGKLAGLDQIKDGQTAESVVKFLAYTLKQSGQAASIDILPFRLEN